MRKNLVNRERVEGRVYDHKLALKKVQDSSSENFGKEFINGTLDVVTDEKCMNVVSVHFTYVTEFTKSGSRNATYAALKKIMDEGKTVLADGKDNATLVKIDTALALNDFYTTRNGEEELVSAKRHEGGFVTIVSSISEDESTRNTFRFDMLINGTRLVEADGERIKEDYLVVKGAIFNFRNDILPIELVVRSQGGISFFQSMDANPQNMIFTQVWGKIDSQNIVSRKVTEAAFGEDAVTESTRTIRELVITSAAKEQYPIGDEENGITMEELQQALTNRNVYLADVKKRSDEYQASKNNANVGAAPATAGGFNF